MIKQDKVYKENGIIVHVGEWSFEEDGETVIIDPSWVESIEDVETMTDGSRMAVSDYRQRRKYPSIMEQLDALWHDMESGKVKKADSFYQMIKKVKDDNPKPI